MARLRKRLTDHQEYEDLVMEIIQSTDPDAELQDCINAYLQPNPKFYLMMFQAVSKIRDAATLSSDGGQISESENLEANLYELENRLKENSNIIPADLPDSILFDSDLVGWHLADNSKMGYQKDGWRGFQNYIGEKASSISRNLELPFLEWCNKMLKRNYAKHNEICKNPSTCPTNQGYDKRIQYITRLIEDATPIPIEPASFFNIEIPQSKGNKIQWLGTQKELAELFIRLRAKGWITDFEPETIKDCFTNSNTIDQILKPGEYTEDLGGTFEQVFTPEYVSKFHGVLPNPKRR